jgi:hypothetical protein
LGVDTPITIGVCCAIAGMAAAPKIKHPSTQDLIPIPASVCVPFIGTLFR